MPQSTDRLLSTSSNGEEASEGRAQTLPVNMYTTEQAIVLVAPMPAVTADDVHVSVEGGRAIIKADCRTEAPKEYLLHEWHYGPYEREVELPDGFRGDAEATFGNGQLALRIERGEGDSAGPVTIATKPNT